MEHLRLKERYGEMGWLRVPEAWLDRFTLDDSDRTHLTLGLPAYAAQMELELPDAPTVPLRRGEYDEVPVWLGAEGDLTLDDGCAVNRSVTAFVRCLLCREVFVEAVLGARGPNALTLGRFDPAEVERFEFALAEIEPVSPFWRAMLDDLQARALETAGRRGRRGGLVVVADGRPVSELQIAGDRLALEALAAALTAHAASHNEECNLTFEDPAWDPSWPEMTLIRLDEGDDPARPS